MKPHKSLIFLIPLLAFAACRREEPSTARTEPAPATQAPVPTPKQEAPALPPATPPAPLPSKTKANEINPADRSPSDDSSADSSSAAPVNPTPSENSPPPVPSLPTPAPPVYPTAARMPGKVDMVLSPYTNKMIDVSGMAPGSLAKDPTDGRIFRVP